MRGRAVVSYKDKTGAIAGARQTVDVGGVKRNFLVTGVVWDLFTERELLILEDPTLPVCAEGVRPISFRDEAELVDYLQGGRPDIQSALEAQDVVSKKLGGRGGRG